MAGSCSTVPSNRSNSALIASPHRNSKVAYRPSYSLHLPKRQLVIPKSINPDLQGIPYTVYTYLSIRCIHMSRSTKSVPTTPTTAAAILAAARDLLDRKGVAAVAMRPVAEKVGITPMAIYRHFADRDSLLNAVANAGFHDLAAQLQSIHLKGDVEHRLMQVGEVFLDATLQSPNLYELMFLVPREGARVYPQDFKPRRSPTFNPTVNILEDAMRNGELQPDDAIEIAFELSALSHGLIVLYLGGRVAQTEKQFRSLYQRCFRRYLNGLR